MTEARSPDRALTRAPAARSPDSVRTTWSQADVSVKDEDSDLAAEASDSDQGEAELVEPLQNCGYWDYFAASCDGSSLSVAPALTKTIRWGRGPFAKFLHQTVSVAAKRDKTGAVPTVELRIRDLLPLPFYVELAESLETSGVVLQKLATEAEK